MIEQITSQENFNEVLRSNPHVLAEFFATWCPHCKAFYPVLESVSEELNKEGVKVVQIDVDAQEGIADFYGIQSIPTLTFFENGSLIELSSGERPAQQVLDFVSQSLAAAKSAR